MVLAHSTLLSCSNQLIVSPDGLFWDNKGQLLTLRGNEILNTTGKVLLSLQEIPNKLHWTGSDWLILGEKNLIWTDGISLIGRNERIPGFSFPVDRCILGPDGIYLLRNPETQVFSGWVQENGEWREVFFPSFTGELLAAPDDEILIGLKNTIELWRWEKGGVGWYLWHNLQSPADFFMTDKDFTRVMTLESESVEIFPLDEGPLKAGLRPSPGPVILSPDGLSLIYWDQGLQNFNLENFEKRPYLGP